MRTLWNVKGINGISVIAIDNSVELKSGTIIEYDGSHWGDGISLFFVSNVNHSSRTIEVSPYRGVTSLKAYPTCIASV